MIIHINKPPIMQIPEVDEHHLSVRRCGSSILWAVIRSMGSTSTKSLDQTPGSREEILRKLRERIVGFAASRMQRDAAEDLAQEVLILLHEKYGDLDRLEDLLPLSLKIVRFKMLAHRRKARRHGEFTQVPSDEIQMPDGRTDALTAMEQREARERSDGGHRERWASGAGNCWR